MSKSSQRNYKREVALQSKQDIKDRAKRNAARRELKKALTKKYGEARATKILTGKDVGHKKALASGGSNRLSNVKVQSIKSNRSDKSMVKRPGRKKTAPKARHKVKTRR